MIRATVQEENSVSVEEYRYDYAGNRTVKITEEGTSNTLSGTVVHH